MYKCVALFVYIFFCINSYHRCQFFSVITKEKKIIVYGDGNSLVVFYWDDERKKNKSSWSSLILNFCLNSITFPKPLWKFGVEKKLRPFFVAS